MNSDFRRQIHENLNLKETDELLAIWRTNDHVEWSDEAFQAAREILEERKAGIPKQDEPIYEHGPDEEEFDENDFSTEELKIIDDENPPDFYDPLEVLKLSKWVDLAAKVVIILSIIFNLMNFPSDMTIAQSYFIGFSQDAGSVFTYIAAIVMMIINAAISIVIVYFPLKALARMLKILMGMEFASRKAK